MWMLFFPNLFSPNYVKVALKRTLPYIYIYMAVSVLMQLLRNWGKTSSEKIASTSKQQIMTCVCVFLLLIFWGLGSHRIEAWGINECLGPWFDSKPAFLKIVGPIKVSIPTFFHYVILPPRPFILDDSCMKITHLDLHFWSMFFALFVLYPTRLREPPEKPEPIHFL